MAEERKVMLVLKDQDGLDVRTTLISLETALPIGEVVPAVKAACQEYLNTVEGRKQYQENCENFNYGDFDMYVPNSICEHHGFTKAGDDDVDVIDDDFNTLLGEPEELEGTGFMLAYTSDKNIEVTGEDIDDIIDSAMCGCTYWCESAEPVGCYLGEYASEQISRGGEIDFSPFEDPAVRLDKEKFQKGLTMWLASLSSEKLRMMIPEDMLDPGQIDAEDADSILQYALFGELVYS